MTSQSGSELEIINYILDKTGFNVDCEIPEELYEQNQDTLTETSRSIVNQAYPDAKTMRDDRSRKSLHLTDYRSIERENKVSDTIVGHVEHFNPEKHFILHLLVDLPLWFFRNRIVRKNKL